MLLFLSIGLRYSCHQHAAPRPRLAASSSVTCERWQYCRDERSLPPMSAEERRSLRNDLVMHGLRVPIIRRAGMVLEGWYRYQLCIEESIEPRFEDYADDDPFGLVRSLNLSRRHLTLAQKKEVAKHIFEREPGRTANSVAQEVGLSQPTAQKVQDSVEQANSKNSNNGNGAGLVEQSYAESHVGDGPAEPVTGAPGEEMPPAPTPVRVEVSGRKARGRKPLSPVEKARRANERAKARLAAQKETKPKPLTSARDAAVNALAEFVASATPTSSRSSRAMRRDRIGNGLFA